MDANPPLGVVLHAIGGLASAVFYLPYRKVKHWAWESYWLTGGVFSWIVAPWVIAFLAVPDLLTVLRNAPAKSLFWSYFFGALWGVGGLTFGLTVRYLGFALGTAMALGYCAAFGTLLPPIVRGELAGVVKTTSGIIVMAGVAVCLLGIIISGLAGISKEREMPEKEKKAAIREFSFAKGVWVATFCGIMSACMSYGFAAGKPIAALAVSHGASELWKNLPVLIIVLAGGFTTNLIWCAGLNIRNKTADDYFKLEKPEIPSVGSAPRTVSVPLLANYAFSALAGTIWYLQFFFYGMGTSKMGRFDFSSWTLHMASIIIFGTLVGVYLSEWNGVSRRTHRLMIFGLAVLVASTVVIGYGNYLNQASAASADPRQLDGGANQVLEERVFPESQRDSATKPRVARHELPWGNGSRKQNPNGVSALVNVRRGSQPRWDCCFLRFLSRVARASPVLRSSGPPQSEADLEATAEGGQPWALGRNPFGIGRLPKSDLPPLDGIQQQASRAAPENPAE